MQTKRQGVFRLASPNPLCYEAPGGWIMVSFLTFWTLATASVDPLFLRMVGSWHGEGERIFFYQGKRVHFEASVNTTVKDGRLISQNEITETPILGPGENGIVKPHKYTRTYWIRPKHDNPTFYELGYVQEGEERTAGLGTLEEDHFKVEQNMGGSPPLLFSSQTNFLAENESFYVDTISQGPVKISESRIRYHRLSPNQ